MAEFLNPLGNVDRHGNKLPHWQQGEVVQFVTFRLGDALPVDRLTDWKEEHSAWLAAHPKPWNAETEQQYHRQFTQKLDKWLDEGSGSCLFREVEIRQILEEILMRFQGVRVEHHAWVIMPNHVHLLFAPKESLSKLVQAWKGTSAHRIGLGSIWQRNYRDTLIRDGSHFANAVRYIRRNPAKLQQGTFTLWESPRALEIN